MTDRRTPTPSKRRSRTTVTIDGILLAELERRMPTLGRSSATNAVLRAWLDGGATEVPPEAPDVQATRPLRENPQPDLPPMLQARLERESRAITRLDRDLQILLETIGLFIRHQLSIAPPLPETDQAAALALGQLRFEHFITIVGRRVAARKSLAEQIIATLLPRDRAAAQGAGAQDGAAAPPRGPAAPQPPFQPEADGDGAEQDP